MAESEVSVSQTVKALLGLREMILSGELAPGARISELAVVERLGVSRTPVRAALARLREEGLLEETASRGYAVRAFTEAEIYDAIEVRGTLEGLAARFAAERGVSAADMARLRACVEEIDAVLARGDRTVDSFTQYVAANDRFHSLLVELARSDVLRRQIERAVSLPFASPNGFVMAQATLPAARDVLVVAQEQHRAVVDAIESRQGARAEALMQEHARIAHRNLQLALENQKVMALVPGASLIRRREQAG
jgi:GntR family transcriptional regulator of vanillate catabolism